MNSVKCNTSSTPPSLIESLAISSSHEVLTDIYKKDINITIWKRGLCKELEDAINKLLKIHTSLNITISLKPQDAYRTMVNELGDTPEAHILSKDISLLVDMFCYLFDLKRAGIRLNTLEKAMCPRFHVDKVPCRLVTTYRGSTTEWLPNIYADRNQLGIHNSENSDKKSGLYKTSNNIYQSDEGDVSLLKGELWIGNKGSGLIHRSPQVVNGEKRLFMSFDFVDD